MKKILFLCTGNSCRSIIAEAQVNAFINGVSAKSAGVKAGGKVNENAKKVLLDNSIWDDNYYSKNIDDVIDDEFDLVVTVCDNAKETCPMFPKKTKLLHVSFEDPDGKDYDEFVKTYEDIKSKLLPIVRDELC